MAGRIRCIKPEINEARRTAALSSDAWRLYVSLKLQADDYGNLTADLDRLLAAVFWAAPRKPRMSSLMTELTADPPLVILYEHDGQQYAHLTGWETDQKIDHPGLPRVPGPDPAETERQRASIQQANRERVAKRTGRSREVLASTGRAPAEHRPRISRDARHEPDPDSVPPGGSATAPGLQSGTSSLVAGQVLTPSVDDDATASISPDPPSVEGSTSARVETNTGESFCLSPLQSTPKRQRKAPPAPAVTTPIWSAYAAAYKQRWGAEPVRSAKSNALIKRFLDQVPAEEASEIAAFYAVHPSAFYVSRAHPLELLVQDAPKLRMEWATGQLVNAETARREERTAANPFLKLARDAEERERREREGCQ